MKGVTKKNDTDDKSKETERKKTKLLHSYIIFLSIIVLAIVFFLFPIDPGAKGSSSPKTTRMKKMAVKIGKLEVEVRKKQNELINLLKTYSQKTNTPPPVLNKLGLSDEEKKILENKIINQKDVSIESLLKDILNKNNEISRLKIEMEKREALLPKAHIVTGEETHYQIALDFLMNEKKVERERALKLVEETILFAPLIPGFRVWNFYSGDEFGTFVTQGTAYVSPIEFRKSPETYLNDLEEKLTTKINNLRSVKDQLEFQINNLRYEKKEMIKKLSYLGIRNIELQKDLNSLFYTVDSEENLIKRGIIIKSKILGIVRLGPPKLKEILPRYFDQQIDLREKNIIEINVRQLKLKKIKKITLHPRFYKRGSDYEVKIEEDKLEAAITILAVDKFRGERIVISIE
jgi:hypothetical protein